MTTDLFVVGQGPRKVLALHGWFGSAASWGPFVDVLDTERFTYAFMDCRGYGKRKDVRGEYTMQEVAEDAVQVLDQLGWRRASLMGHSMGGAAIQHVLTTVPDRIEALVAITPVPASGVPFDDQGWSLFQSAVTSPQARHGILDFSTGNRLSQYWLAGMVQKSLERSSQQAFGAYLNSWAKADIAAKIQGKSLPVLAVVGAHDPALGEAFVRATWLNHYPNARLEIMANAGHYPMDETPVALATAVERFFAESVAV